MEGEVALMANSNEIAWEAAGQGAPAEKAPLSNKHIPEPKSGQGAQFVYVAATVANILCDNLTQQQINLLANFFAVVSSCVYAILTVENPSDIIE